MQDLVQRATKGDREAFGAIASAELDPLYALARRILQDHDLAEEAVQVAVLRAWHDLPKLRDPAAFEPWMRRLLIHACYDEAAKKRSFRARVRVLPTEPRCDDPTGQIADREELECAFSRLTIDQRTVLVLHFYEGRPLKEIGQVLGIPEGTARSRLHYALEALRGALAAESRQELAMGHPA